MYSIQVVKTIVIILNILLHAENLHAPYVQVSKIEHIPRVVLLYLLGRV